MNRSYKKLSDNTWVWDYAFALYGGGSFSHHNLTPCILVFPPSMANPVVKYLAICSALHTILIVSVCILTVRTGLQAERTTRITVSLRRRMPSRRVQRECKRLSLSGLRPPAAARPGLNSFDETVSSYRASLMKNGILVFGVGILIILQ